MSKAGADWYKREPIAYLADTQGLSSKEHAVYSIVLELIYVHGGEINNDPRWISGWISDMGSAAVSNALKALASRSSISLEITPEKISQKRAKAEAKTKANLREVRRENGKIGGIKSGETRKILSENGEKTEKKRSSFSSDAVRFSEGSDEDLTCETNENNNLGEARVSSKTQADKIREEKKKNKQKVGSDEPSFFGDEILQDRTAKKPDFSEPFEAFWKLWPTHPRKANKAGAKDLFDRICLGKSKHGETSADDIVRGATNYIQSLGGDLTYLKAPIAWLNGGLWQGYLHVQDQPKESRYAQFL